MGLKHGLVGHCKHCRSNNGRMKGNPRNYNTYEFVEDICIGYTNDKQQFFLDKEDYDLIKDYCWHINGDGYVATQKNKKKILMHRLLTGVADEFDIDHKNRIRNFNLKSNLNIVTKKENNQNHSLYKNNTSGVTGVSYDKNLGKWMSYIGVNGKRINGGIYSNMDDAINSRKQLEEQYFYYLESLKKER